MKLPELIYYLPLLFLFGISNQVFTQVSKSEILQKNWENLALEHEKDFGDLKDVISGTEHRAVYHYTSGHPFWEQMSWFLGSVQTSIHYYPNLTIRYDLYRDVLLYLPDSLSVDYMAVNQNLVLHFVLDGVVFVNLGLHDELRGVKESTIEPGYYEWIYSGKTQLYAKNSKDLTRKSGDANAHSEFQDKRNLYLQVDGVYHQIKKKKELLTALAPYRNEVKTFIRKNRIGVRRINDLQFIELLRYYDSL